MKVTLDDVAQRAGTSLSTASKALNHRSDVSAATRRRVLDAAAELGYGGVGDRTRPARISVAFDSIDNFYSPQVLEGIVAEASGLGVEVVLASRSGQGSRVAGTVPWLDHAAAQGSTAAILVNLAVTPDVVQAGRNHGLEVVAIDPLRAVTGTEVFTIAATNQLGAALATRHLLELGHRRIALVTGPRDSLPSHERSAGCSQALTAAGLAVDPDLVVEGDFRHESGLAAARYLLALDAPPTAVFAFSDAMAFGVAEAARRRDVDVPDGLSIVGFDDGYATRCSVPPLTTVRQPLHAMGALAVRHLCGLPEAPGDTAPRLETHLVVRSSTAVPLQPGR